jgi:hypothetical protein
MKNNLSQETQSLHQDLNPEHLEYEATWPWCLVEEEKKGLLLYIELKDTNFHDGAIMLFLMHGY